MSDASHWMELDYSEYWVTFSLPGCQPFNEGAGTWTKYRLRLMIPAMVTEATGDEPSTPIKACHELALTARARYTSQRRTLPILSTEG